MVKYMKKFSTNWALYDPLTPKNKKITTLDSEDLSEEIQHEIKLINKAFG